MHTIPEARVSIRQGLFLCIVSGLLGVGILTFDQFLPPVLLVLAAAVGSIVALAIFADPRVGLFVAIAHIYAGLSFYFKLYAAWSAVAATLVVCLIQVLRGDRVQLRNSAFNWSAALFGILTLQSMIFAYSLSSTFVGFTSFLKVLIIVFLVVQIVRTPRVLEQLAVVMFIGAVATVALGTLNIVMGWAEGLAVIPGMAIRFQGTHVNANSSAVYMISGIPIGVYLIRRYRSAVSRITVGVGTVSLAVATFLTYSRGAIFPLAFVVIAVIVREARNKRFYAGFAALVVATLLLTPAYYWERLLSIQELVSGLTSDASILMRLKAMEEAWAMFLENPLTGVGLFNFLNRSGGELLFRIVVHNTYLEILVGVGLLGFAAYVAMLGVAAGEYWRALKTNWGAERGWMNPLSYYLLASYLSTLVGAMFLSVPFYYVIWVPLGCGLAVGNLAGAAAGRTSDR